MVRTCSGSFLYCIHFEVLNCKFHCDDFLCIICSCLLIIIQGLGDDAVFNNIVSASKEIAAVKQAKKTATQMLFHLVPKVENSTSELTEETSTGCEKNQKPFKLLELKHMRDNVELKGEWNRLNILAYSKIREKKQISFRPRSTENHTWLSANSCSASVNFNSLTFSYVCLRVKISYLNVFLNTTQTRNCIRPSTCVLCVMICDPVVICIRMHRSLTRNVMCFASKILLRCLCRSGIYCRG